MNTNNLHRLIVKYLNEQASFSERNELDQSLKKSENFEVFKTYVKTNYLINLNKDTYDAEDSKRQLLSLIEKEKKVFKFRKYTRVMKYAAIVALFLGGSYFYYNNLENEQAPIENITLQLENGNIEIINENGSSKIVDAQGAVVGAQNGTQLIYNNDNNLESLVYNTLTVPYGKRSKVRLSDGTVVNLNAGTSLRFPIKFIEGKDREVFLERGEAYFDVAKDANHPFIVNTDEVGIRVLGTQFNVSSYPEDKNITTVLVEGSVNVYDKQEPFNTETATLLEPGYKAKWHKGKDQITVKKADLEIHTAWINGRIIFKHVPFNNIIRKLERHYNVEIINNDEVLGKDLITASFDIETIDQVFNVINEIHPIDYTIKDRKIIIN
jgi:ferric-dicitrate binding protein FerR (iron transport regulator)